MGPFEAGHGLDSASISIKTWGPFKKTPLTVKTNRVRTIASAITYRVTSTILLAAISYVITGQWLESLAVTLTFAVLATILFYFNDRAWERTDWGRKPGIIPDATGLEVVSADVRRGSHVATELIPLHHEFLEEAS